ncbi:hypothetical protein C0989_003349 [Termitomyces sp. Mn162]|nr:hypothetical protein C0989_003349 [Termitomyces sp. Mn162]
MSEVRHITSNTALVSPRLSQHIRGHSPARSPTSISIPSSPTSVHSSSSAIFERDIEPLLPPSPLNHPASPANAHRIPRSKATETIEHSVPSVLDSAAAILASMENANDVAIVAPAPFRSGSGFASPIRSRSPSPAVGGRNSLLLSIPHDADWTEAPAFAQHSPITPGASNRLSFIAYADLLTSAPTSTVPLSSLTTAASASEPPPHIPTVACPTTASAAASLRAFSIDPSPAGSPKRSRDPAAALLSPDAVGEWEREGLGRGLEERLDVLYRSHP